MTLEILGKILAVFDRVFNIVSLIILPLNFFFSNSILSPDNILTNIVFWSVRHPSLLVYIGLLVTCQKSQKLNQKNTFWPYDLARFLQSRLCNFSFNLNFYRRSWCHLNNHIKTLVVGFIPRSSDPKYGQRPFMEVSILISIFGKYWSRILSLELSPPYINHLHEDSTWWKFS